jgi:hypothetical protein
MEKKLTLVEKKAHLAGEIKPGVVNVLNAPQLPDLVTKRRENVSSQGGGGLADPDMVLKKAKAFMELELTYLKEKINL